MTELQQLRILLNNALDVIENDRVQSKLPEHTLGPDLHPCDDPNTVPSARVYQARRTALACLAQIKASIQPAPEQVQEWTMMAYDLAAVYTCNRTGVFLILAAAPQGLHVNTIVDQLAEDQKLNPDKLARILRLISCAHWVTETAPNVFKPTRLSTCLTEEGDDGSICTSSMAAWVECIVKNCLESSQIAFVHWTDPLTRDATSPYDAVWQRGRTDKITFWDALERDPQCMACFAAAMTGYGQSTVGACLADFDWEGLGDATLVDVGGGRGSLSLPVAQRHPHLNVVVQDRRETCVEAERLAKKIMPDAVDAGRVAVQPQDFFQPNQQCGPNTVYILRAVLHDWSDELATQILRNISSVMHKTSRILVIENIVKPSDGANFNGSVESYGQALRNMQDRETGFQPLVAPFPLSPNFVAAERITNAIDIAMDLWFSARDRSMPQVHDLVVAAGLQVVHIHRTRSLACIIEVALPNYLVLGTAK